MMQETTEEFWSAVGHRSLHSILSVGQSDLRSRLLMFFFGWPLQTMDSRSILILPSFMMMIRLCLREDRIYKKRVGKRIDRDYVDCHRTSDLLCRDKSIQHSAMTRVAGFGIVSWIRTDYVRDIERSSKQTSVMLPPFPECVSFKINTRKLRFQTDLLILCCQSSPYLTK